MSMTDKDTPFKPSTTQKIFHNAANVSLRGSTYDALHLDKFLGSNFGERSIQIDGAGQPMYNKKSAVMGGSARANTATGVDIQGGLLSSGLNSSAIKPSVSFVSMSR
jgi:hypothetical protein